LLDFVDARDPQIERLMLSLKAELEAGGAALAGRLYAESLANALAVHLLREHSYRETHGAARCVTAVCSVAPGGRGGA
jgi:AraC family transcriptional regulator